MTYTKINLYLANGIPEALSNLWYGSDSAVVEGCEERQGPSEPHPEDEAPAEIHPR